MKVAVKKAIANPNQKANPMEVDVKKASPNNKANPMEVNALLPIGADDPEEADPEEYVEPRTPKRRGIQLRRDGGTPLCVQRWVDGEQAVGWRTHRHPERLHASYLL